MKTGATVQNTEKRDNLAEIKALYHGKARLRVDEVRTILGDVGRDYIYDLLELGLLVAQNKANQVPGKKGIFVLAWSVWSYLENNTIPASAWSDLRGDALEEFRPEDGRDLEELLEELPRSRG